MTGLGLILGGLGLWSLGAGLLLGRRSKHQKVAHENRPTASSAVRVGIGMTSSLASLLVLMIRLLAVEVPTSKAEWLAGIGLAVTVIGITAEVVYLLSSRVD